MSHYWCSPKAGLTQEQVTNILNTKKSAIFRIGNHAEDIRLSTFARGFAPTCREPPFESLTTRSCDWNVGILVYWNNGFWNNGMVGLKNQKNKIVRIISAP